MAAGEVILRRSMRMSQGKMTGPEAIGMVMEKATTFAAAGGAGGRRGGDRRQPGADRRRRAAADPRQDALERAQVPPLSRRPLREGAA